MNNPGQHPKATPLRMKPLFVSIVVTGMLFAVVQPVFAAEYLAASTVKAWCKVGHGVKVEVKLGPLTWNRFDYLAGNAVNEMTKTKFAIMGATVVNWKINAAMGGAGSEAEDVLVSWLREIIANGSSDAISFTKLPANVDIIRAIATKLKVAVSSDPQMFNNDAGYIQRTKKALAQFARFEKAYDEFAPDLANACSASHAHHAVGNATRIRQESGRGNISDGPARVEAVKEGRY